MSAGQPFNPRLVIGLIAAGIAAFVVLLLLIAYGGNIGQSRDGRAHALSSSAVGFKGLVGLVGSFHDTRLIREPAELETENLVVIALELQTRPDQLRRALEQRHGRATLIILPKWVTIAEPIRRGWVRALGAGAGVPAAAMIGDQVRVDVAESRANARGLARGEDFLGGLAVPVPRSPQTVRGPGLIPLVPLGGGTLVARLGDQPHYVVADPDLLNNHGLREAATARAALALIEALNSTGADAVTFDLTLNGLGTSADSQDRAGLLRLAFEPPFLAMTLAFFAAALLAGLHGAARFGPARREGRAIAFGKAALVENSAGLIRLAEREARLGAAYADVVRQEIARASHAPAGLQGGELDSHLNRLGRGEGPSFSELAADLYRARDRHSLIAAARALFRWKKDIIR